MQSITLPMPDYTALDDAALVKNARGDADAFAALHHRYLTPLYRYLYRRLGNEKDAEDLTSQVFTEVLEGLAVYRERGRFASWLFTIARRRLVDLYRERVPVELDDPPDGMPGLQVVLEQDETYSHLADLLAQLSEEQQEILRLRFAAGLDFAEIATILGRNTGAVKMNLYRTLVWLRANWEIVHE
jgi:RNA polymerase sigma-70 factor, ECF subfamily